MSADPTPTVLHITAAPGGGVDRYIRDLAHNSARRHLVWHVGPAVDVLEDVAAARFLPLRDISGDEAGAAVLARWLNAVGVGIAHVHGLTETCRARLSALRQAHALPYVVTLHDLMFLNPLAFDAPGMPEADPQWIAGLLETLERAAAVIVPSRFIHDVAGRCLPGLRVAMIPPGIRVAPVPQVREPPAEFDANAPRHVVAVLGAIGPHKGSGLLDDLAAALEGTDICLAVIGYTDRMLMRGWVVPGRYYVHGPYTDDELPGLLAAYRAEIVLFPNRIPESFSYTLSEVWAAGITAVVPDEGALGERVAQHGGGWRLPAGFAARDAATLLARLLSTEGAAECARVKSRISPLDHERIPTLAAMAKDADALYARFALKIPDAGYSIDARDALAPLLAANLDGFVFRKELVILAAEVARLRAGAPDEARIARLEAYSAKLEHDARTWTMKLEADIATVKAEFARCFAENRVLADQKAAFDQLPEVVRKFLLKKAFRARR